jgi:hypothetical protein
VDTNGQEIPGESSETRAEESRIILLNRKRAALYLETVYGARCSASTMAKMAVAGTGPGFRCMGRFPVYNPADLDAWAKAKLGPVVHSTAAYPPRDYKPKGRPRKNFAQLARGAI